MPRGSGRRVTAAKAAKKISALESAVETLKAGVRSVTTKIHNVQGNVNENTQKIELADIKRQLEETRYSAAVDAGADGSGYSFRVEIPPEERKSLYEMGEERRREIEQEMRDKPCKLTSAELANMASRIVVNVPAPDQPGHHEAAKTNGEIYTKLRRCKLGSNISNIPGSTDMKNLSKIEKTQSSSANRWISGENLSHAAESRKHRVANLRANPDWKDMTWQETIACNKADRALSDAERAFFDVKRDFPNDTAAVKKANAEVVQAKHDKDLLLKCKRNTGIARDQWAEYDYKTTVDRRERERLADLATEQESGVVPAHKLMERLGTGTDTGEEASRQRTQRSEEIAREQVDSLEESLLYPKRDRPDSVEGYKAVKRRGSRGSKGGKGGGRMTPFSKKKKGKSKKQKRKYRTQKGGKSRKMKSKYRTQKGGKSKKQTKRKYRTQKN